MFLKRERGGEKKGGEGPPIGEKKNMVKPYLCRVRMAWDCQFDCRGSFGDLRRVSSEDEIRVCSHSTRLQCEHIFNCPTRE